uniref:Uncharacterized protein n=1 Tax=Rhizophora mucronata TaxID=61149 RepID=A0A2P2PV11_RHIMU
MPSNQGADTFRQYRLMKLCLPSPLLLGPCLNCFTILKLSAHSVAGAKDLYAP